MNLQHATALALVGWYLMVTPLSNKHGPNGKAAPLIYWEHPYTFDSRHDCETALAAAHVSEARGMADVSLRTGLSEQESLAIPMDSIDWFCIATDDPRLKEK